MEEPTQEVQRIYKELQEIARPIHAHSDQMLAIAHWIDSEKNATPLTPRLKTHLTDKHAFEVGSLLGFIDEVAQKKGRRFHACLKGDVKNYAFAENIHWSDLQGKLVPALSFMIRNNYTIK